MISEGSCDTKCWSIDAENSALYQNIKQLFINSESVVLLHI